MERKAVHEHKSKIRPSENRFTPLLQIGHSSAELRAAWKWDFIIKDTFQHPRSAAPKANGIRKGDGRNNAPGAA